MCASHVGVTSGLITNDINVGNKPAASLRSALATRLTATRLKSDARWRSLWPLALTRSASTLARYRSLVAPLGRLRRRRFACFARGPRTPRSAFGSAAAATLQRRLAAPCLGRGPRLPIRQPLKVGRLPSALASTSPLALRSSISKTYSGVALAALNAGRYVRL